MANLVKHTGNFLIISAARSLKEVHPMAENNGVDTGADVDVLTSAPTPISS